MFEVNYGLNSSGHGKNNFQHQYIFSWFLSGSDSFQWVYTYYVWSHVQTMTLKDQVYFNRNILSITSRTYHVRNIVDS